MTSAWLTILKLETKPPLSALGYAVRGALFGLPAY